MLEPNVTFQLMTVACADMRISIFEKEEAYPILNQPYPDKIQILKCNCVTNKDRADGSSSLGSTTNTGKVSFERMSKHNAHKFIF